MPVFAALPDCSYFALYLSFRAAKFISIEIAKASAVMIGRGRY